MKKKSGKTNKNKIKLEIFFKKLIYIYISNFFIKL